VRAARDSFALSVQPVNGYMRQLIVEIKKDQFANVMIVVSRLIRLVKNSKKL
jgi:hypothetical protein